MTSPSPAASRFTFCPFTVFPQGEDTVAVMTYTNGFEDIMSTPLISNIVMQRSNTKLGLLCYYLGRMQNKSYFKTAAGYWILWGFLGVGYVAFGFPVLGFLLLAEPVLGIGKNSVCPAL